MVLSYAVVADKNEELADRDESEGRDVVAAAGLTERLCLLLPYWEAA